MMRSSLAGSSSEEASVKASVCICTYNGAGRIRKVLGALAQQTMAKAWWEVIVIDNASKDATGAVAERCLAELLHGAGRVVQEPRPGLAFARARAGQEARGEILCFLDDDNIPAPSWLANAVEAFGSRPSAGAIGGKVFPVWDARPTPLVLAVQDFALAICDRGDAPFRYQAGLGPVGAGLCIRTAALREIYGARNRAEAVVGRCGAGFGGGEDLAIALLTWRMGLECWYDPSLVIQHILPASRMQKEYLLRLYEGIGRGQAAVRRLWDWKARTPLLGTLIGCKDLVRWSKGQVLGPPAALWSSHPELARDLHQLQQRLVWGRAVQGFRFS